MMRARLMLAAAFLSLSFAQESVAQGENPLVGAWERVSATNPDGTPDTHATALMIFTSLGYWSMMSIPPNRPKVATPVQEMTRDELLARFDYVQSRYGKYTINSTQLIRNDTANINPNAEGRNQVVGFRIVGDTLILSSTDPGSQARASWRRIK